MRILLRILTLGSSALLCAAVSGFIALFVAFFVQAWLLPLPETDEAAGMTLFEFLADPAVWIAWSFWVLAGGAIGFGVSLWALRRADLKRAVPLICAVTIGTTAIFSPFGPLAFFPALIAGCTAILWCRKERSFRLPRPS